MNSYKSREEVPDKYKWNLDDFCKNDKDFDNKLNKLQSEIKKLDKYVGCTKDPKKLYDYLIVDLDIFCRLEDIWVYAYLINDTMLGNTNNLQRLNKVSILANEYETKSAFFVPELLKLSKTEYQKLFDNKDLLEYRRYLDMIFREKDYSLNENESIIESTIVNAINHFEEENSTLINSLHNYGYITVDGKKEQLAFTNYRKFLKNKDVKIRKKAYTLLNKKLDEYSTMNASLLNNYIGLQNSLTKIHKFSSPWERKLFSLNLSNDVFENLRITVENNVKSIQKFYNLKKKVLNLDKLNIYDLSLEMGKSNKKYTIEESQKILLESLKPLGDDYLKHFKKIFDNHYIDYCQYKGKTSGAYSCSTPLNDSRILMSFNDDLDSISTIAHEGGHNVHHQYVKQCNPATYRNVTNLVAEVASLTNEFLLSEYISNNATSKEEKLHGIENVINVMISNLFGAVREAKMEQDMYEVVFNDGMLTKDYLDKLSYDSLKKYYGKSVKLDKYSKNGWVTRSHYYMFYYLYNYAICVSVASNVASEIIKGNKDMLNRYIDFLKTGSDVWPIDSFKNLGFDITKKEVYENAIKYFDELVIKYQKIYEEKKV